MPLNGSDIGVSKFDVINAVRSVAGEEAVQRLKKKHGGTEIDIPVKASPGSWLSKLIGVDRAQAVIDILDVRDANGRAAFHVYLSIDNGGVIARAKARCLAMLAEGKSIPQIREETGLSERSAFKYQAEYRVSLSSPQRLLASGLGHCLYRGEFFAKEKVLVLSDISFSVLRSLPENEYIICIDKRDEEKGNNVRHYVLVTSLDIAIFNFESDSDVALLLNIKKKAVQNRTAYLRSLGILPKSWRRDSDEDAS